MAARSAQDYSGTPLPKKLGITEGTSVAFPGASEEFWKTLGVLPDSVSIKGRVRGNLDVIVFFTTRRSELERRFRPLAAALVPSGGLWVAYPKRTSGMETDLTFEVVQSAGLRAGLADNKSCSIDDVWSGLRFVYRLSDR